MLHKVIRMVGIFTFICLIGFITFSFFNHDLFSKEESNSDIKNNMKEDGYMNLNIKDDAKVIVVYFSATNNTKNVAEKIADNLNGDLFEIEPIEEYTSEDLDWTDENSRVSREHEDENLREVELKTSKVEGWEDYDIVFIGYPIWWGIAAWPVNTFVLSNDFTGKTVIPFCTSASSGLGQSGDLLVSVAKGGDWHAGYRFSSSSTDDDIKKFTDELKDL